MRKNEAESDIGLIHQGSARAHDLPYTSKHDLSYVMSSQVGQPVNGVRSLNRGHVQAFYSKCSSLRTLSTRKCGVG